MYEVWIKRGSGDWRIGQVCGTKEMAESWAASYKMSNYKVKIVAR